MVYEVYQSSKLDFRKMANIHGILNMESAWNNHCQVESTSMGTTCMKKGGNLHIKGKFLYKYGNWHIHVKKTWWKDHYKKFPH